jgi:hypothetical protein
MFSGEIGSGEHRTQLPGRLEAGRWLSTRLHDPSIKTQSKQRCLPLIFLGPSHAFGRRAHLSFRGRRHGGVKLVQSACGEARRSLRDKHEEVADE